MKTARRRKLVSLSLLILMLAVGGCSFSTQLVVMNLSDKPVEVRYRFKDQSGKFVLPYVPAIKTEAELNDETSWRQLSADQFVVDSHTRTVRVTLAPRTALRMASMLNRGVSKRPEDARNFPIAEIVMRGANGTMMLQGEQVRMSFAEETDQTYSVAYR